MKCVCCCCRCCCKLHLGQAHFPTLIFLISKVNPHTHREAMRQWVWQWKLLPHRTAQNYLSMLKHFRYMQRFSSSIHEIGLRVRCKIMMVPPWCGTRPSALPTPYSCQMKRQKSSRKMKYANDVAIVLRAPCSVLQLRQLAAH